MGRRPKWGRPVNGVLLLNKEGGMTSNDALQKAKRLFFANRAGHTGSLDPLATGVLPLCFGEATKFSQYLLDADKCYRATFALGAISETCDADGEILSRHDASKLRKKDIEALLPQFSGDIKQVPPMYSALKHQGQPLYKLARQGITVEREARAVTIYDIKVLAFRKGQEAEVDVEVSCSKGTYIRSIAHDMGELLACGAYVKKLHRVSAGPFHEDDAYTLGELEAERGEQVAEVLDELLLPMDAPVESLDYIDLPKDSAYYFTKGNPVMDPQVFQLGKPGTLVRVFDEEELFLGVGELDDEGRVAPKRLVVYEQANH